MMTLKKKKKSSISLHISHPYALYAHTVRFHRNENRTGLSIILSTASLETLGMLHSNHQESDNLLSEYIVNQADIQHDNPAEGHAEGKKKLKQRICTKVIEEWLTHWDTYLQELLRHNGREGLQATLCADCGKSGNYSCYNCAYYMNYCQDCLVNRHHFMPLHWIRVGFKLILSVI